MQSAYAAQQMSQDKHEYRPYGPLLCILFAI